MTRASRGQLVLVAAALAAVAVGAMALAYLGLGAHPDVEASVAFDRPGRDVVRSLDRAVANASADVSGARPWAERDAALAAFETALGPDVRTIERSQLNESVAVAIERNGSAARSWAGTDCPRGPNRRFGPCRTADGVVIQDRAGDGHVLAVAFDVTVTAPRGVASFTVVVTVP